MPDLKTTLHLDMLKSAQAQNSPQLYGMDWGDPEAVEPLRFTRDRIVRPYVNANHCALEVGPGGGRWTRYLIGFKSLYVVDYHQELIDEVRKSFDMPNMKFITNNGTDFPGVKKRSIDYLFSFGVFVHLDIPLLEAYLKNIKPILKPTANVVIHYSDKTKVMAQMNPSFSDNTPELMRKMVTTAGYKIVEEDITTMWHSSVMRFTL